MAPHSSIFAWKIPWAEEPGRLQSMGSLRVGHDWATSLWLFTFLHWRRKWQPTPVGILAWRIPGTGEPHGLTSMGSHRVGHDWSDLAAIEGQAPIMRMILLMMEEKAERREKFQCVNRPKWGIESSTKALFAVQLLFTPKHSCHVQLSEWKDCFLMYCPIQAESMRNWPVDMVGSHFYLLVSEIWKSSLLCTSSVLLNLGSRHGHS